MRREALQFQEECPPAAPSWTGPECLMNRGVAVPEKAQRLGTAPSETGQQETDADQGTQRDDKPESGRRERRHRRKGRRCDFCLTHGEDLQAMQLVLEIDTARRKRAARPEIICPICLLVSVECRTHSS